MLTEEQNQQKINKLVEAIRKVIKEVDPDTKIKDEKIVGLLILQFPADHDKTSRIYGTTLGRICFSHTLKFLIEIYKEQEAKVPKDAT
jgi:hypothetical protein